MTRSATEAAFLARAEEAELALARCVAERQALERDRDAWQERCERARAWILDQHHYLDHGHNAPITRGCICGVDAALSDDPPAR